MKSSMKTVSLVVPVFNEAATIGFFLQAVRPVVDRLPNLAFEFVFVNDGSSDDSLSRLLDAQAADPRIVVIDLSRNFGKEAALTAGLNEASGDAAIPIDIDLQDPPEVIPKLIEQWQAGYEVVLAQRRVRAADSRLKRGTARWFYRIHNWVSESALPEDVGDFRLLDRLAVDALKQFPERRRFMKGLLSSLGFRTTAICYDRKPRVAGRSKFSGWELWNLAIEGITSYSIAPLRIWTYLGLSVALLSFVYLSVIVIRTVWFGVDVPGYASLLVSILFLGGIQLIGTGVLGEYIGRIYMETKQRPIYLVRARFRTPGVSRTEHHGAGTGS